MLVNCVAYQEGRKLADIERHEISDYLARPGSFVWVALRDASAEELEEMREEFGLHELAVEDARHGHQRPKIEEYGDSLFVVMHTVEVAGDELRDVAERGRTIESVIDQYLNTVRPMHMEFVAPNLTAHATGATGRLVPGPREW